jgi:hypothetical protein
MTFEIKKASKKESKLRLGISGPSGSGKTWSALLLAEGMGCKKVCVIDTERSSAELYSDRFKFHTIDFRPPYSPERYMEAIRLCQSEFDIIIIDSISPEWDGEGGCLDIHSKIPGNSYVAWSKVTPKHNKFIESLLACECHLIVTTRSKSEYVLEEKNGKQVPRKVGMAPKQREGLEYELTCFFELDLSHNFIASKDRTGLFGGDIPQALDVSTGERLKNWLGAGEKPVVKQKPLIEESTPIVVEKPKKKAKVIPDVKERAGNLFGAVDQVTDLEGFQACFNEFEAIKGSLPEKPLKQLQDALDALSQRYIVDIEKPF